MGHLTDYRLLVTGSRDWSDYDVIRRAISQVVAERVAETGAPYPPIVVVHGAARGADLLAAKAAGEFRLTPEPHRAVWKNPDGSRNRRAGYERNELMVSLGADLCLAFVMPCQKSGCGGREAHDSHGTAHCMGLARQAGIDIRRIDGSKTS